MLQNLGEICFCKFLKPCPGLEKMKLKKKKNQVGSFKTVSYPRAVLIKTRDLPNTAFPLPIW
jgi:hypothetical protein